MGFSPSLSEVWPVEDLLDSSTLPRDLKADSLPVIHPRPGSWRWTIRARYSSCPSAFCPSLLRELIEYDYKFPVECQAHRVRSLQKLSSLSANADPAWFQAFSQLSLSFKLEHSQLGRASRRSLWNSCRRISGRPHQLDAFRKAAMEYGDRLRSGCAAQIRPAMLSTWNRHYRARRRVALTLRSFATCARTRGTYFDKSEAGMTESNFCSKALPRGRKSHPAPYGHRYIEGGQVADHSPAADLRVLSSAPTGTRRLAAQHAGRNQASGMGPEELRTHLAQMSPADLGMDKEGDAVSNHFQMKLFTEGSGTQIFSTTFAQWAAREALRRAQPLTLLVRSGSRQRQRPMNELLSNYNSNPELDLTGSLIDADMGSDYNWINQQRLPGIRQSSFLVGLKIMGRPLQLDHRSPGGTASNSAADLGELLAWAVS